MQLLRQLSRELQTHTLQAIRDQPGISTSQLAEIIPLGKPSLLYRLHTMERDGLIRSERWKHTGGRPALCWTATPGCRPSAEKANKK